MISIKVPAPELDRLLQNVLLFSDKKAMRLNEILFESQNNQLYGYSCDDYVAVSDWIDLDGVVRSYPFAFSIDDVEALAEWVKKDKKVVHKYDIIIRPKMTGIIFECEDTSTDEESDNIFLTEIVPSKNWNVVFEILNLDLPTRLVFASRPERVSKLWRLKADKEAPLDFRYTELDNKDLYQIKKGSSLVAAIMPVDRSKVNEEYLW